MIETPGRRLAGLRRALHDLETAHSDLPLYGYQPTRRTQWRPRQAAVLVPLVIEPEPAVLLTVRSRRLQMHAGQVAFPGGSPDPGESFPLETALREAEEEIGIPRGDICPLGLLSRYDTITGFRVVPIVGLIEGVPELRPFPAEVDLVFSVPLQQVIDPSSFRRHHVRRGDRVFDLISMRHDRRLIWGATAAILQELSGKLREFDSG